MLKCYSSFYELDKEMVKLLENNGIEVTLHDKKERPNAEELKDIIKNYDIILIGIREYMTKELLDLIDSPKIIGTMSIGVDHIDKCFFDSHLIDVVTLSDSNVISVAEHIFSLVLALNKRIYESNKLVLDKKGNRNNLFERPNDISEKTIGFIGAGKISRAAINIAKVFNMKILCNTLHPEKHKDLDVQFVELDYLLSNSDIISINVPSNNETNNLISKEKINLMKNNATFINTSRLELVDIEVLIEYADRNSSFYVGLDIDTEEVADLLSKYRTNVIVTPHTAGVSKEALDRMEIELVNRVVDFVKNNV